LADFLAASKPGIKEVLEVPAARKAGFLRWLLLNSF